MNKKNFKYYKYRYKVHKELHIHYEELFKTSVSELQFTRLQTDHYKNMLDEVEVLLKKEVKSHLIKKVIDNGKERGYLDMLIHTDLLFKGSKGFKD